MIIVIISIIIIEEALCSLVNKKREILNMPGLVVLYSITIKLLACNF